MPYTKKERADWRWRKKLEALVCRLLAKNKLMGRYEALRIATQRLNAKEKKPQRKPKQHHARYDNVIDEGTAAELRETPGISRKQAREKAVERLLNACRQALGLPYDKSARTIPLKIRLKESSS